MKRAPAFSTWDLLFQVAGMPCASQHRAAGFRGGAATAKVNRASSDARFSEHDATIRRMRKKGATLGEVSLATGMHESSIWRYCTRHGIK